MFGFARPVATDPSAVPSEDRGLERWRRLRCAVCRAIGQRYGQPARLGLNVDAIFLALLLDRHRTDAVAVDLLPAPGRCLARDAATRAIASEPAIALGALANAMAISVGLDDHVADERGLRRHAMRAARSLLAGKNGNPLRARVAREAARHGLELETVTQSVAHLAALEEGGADNPVGPRQAGLPASSGGADNPVGPRQAGLPAPPTLDALLATAGDATSHVFAAAERYRQRQHAMLDRADDGEDVTRMATAGNALGALVLLLDAVIDYPKDRRRGRPNVLALADCEGRTADIDARLTALSTAGLDLASELLREAQEAIAELIGDVTGALAILDGLGARIEQARDALTAVCAVDAPARQRQSALARHAAAAGMLGPGLLGVLASNGNTSGGGGVPWLPVAGGAVALFCVVVGVSDCSRARKRQRMREKTAATRGPGKTRGRRRSGSTSTAGSPCDNCCSDG